MAWFVFVVRCPEDRKSGGHLVNASVSDFAIQTEYWAVDSLIIFYFSLNITRVIKDNMGGECSTYEEDEKCVQDFSWETLVCLSYFGVGEKIKFELILKEDGRE